MMENEIRLYYNGFTEFVLIENINELRDEK